MYISSLVSFPPNAISTHSLLIIILLYCKDFLELAGSHQGCNCTKYEGKPTMDDQITAKEAGGNRSLHTLTSSLKESCFDN